MKILILILFSFTAFAEVSREVLIRGKVAGYFTDKEVKVLDTLGQTMILPRSAFPKDFKFQQGEDFSLEIDPALIKDLKPKKKK